MEQAKSKNGLSPIIPFFVGGLIGGGIAMAFAPQIRKAMDALCAAAEKTKQTMIQKRREREEAKPGEEGIYCDVPEGADICYDEKLRT